MSVCESVYVCFMTIKEIEAMSLIENKGLYGKCWTGERKEKGGMM